MSGTSNVESAEGVVSKVKVKKQIKTIVKDLETILGDLRDVAKELKEVVHEIDSLTCDLQLEEEMTDSSKTDTLNSSSSSTTTTTTTSSIDKIKIAIFRPPSVSHAILTVMKKPHPPLPPPRLTPIKAEEHNKNPLSGSLLAKANGTLMRNGVFPGKPNRDLSCCISKSTKEERGLMPMPLLRHEKTKCPQATRERVRFSEKVQYHGYCPDCDLQYDVDNTDMHLQPEFTDDMSPVHQCSSSSPPSQLMLENGGLSVSHSFPPTKMPCVPHSNPSLKPQKTILRKSTTTTV
ncbi:protein Largen-like [Salvelinus fontinalis]|uniref:protein Largen-like n=1 Tax=Salvelinus fontinalis TaxID=8038 RepID=UPI002485140B|nr:protein Largen-like [Salvelinus fontinalis]XP_055774742.1 protein Largen-like [Salvelinus fontinalis]